MMNQITFIRRALRFTALLLIPGFFALNACFDDGGGGDTDPETYNSSLFVSKSEIGPGAECANGGVRIDMGFDVNRNNVLDPDEVTNTEYVCHGEDASSHPFVVYTWPTPNETDVTRSAKVSLVFNTEMDPATVTESTFTLADESGIPVSGTVEYNDITAVFMPDSRLAPDIKYTVTASPAMENALGIAMGYEHKVFFTTFDKYAVAYHANGATEGTVSAEKYYDAGSGLNIAGNTGGLAKTGSPFVGWCTAPDGTGTCYDGGEPITISSADVDLYARWGYSITFNKNDDGATGTMDQQTMAAGAKDNLNACTFTKRGWTFSGWSTTPGGEVEYMDGAEFTMGTGEVALYAKWVEKAWGAAELIETNETHSASNPNLVVDFSGNVTAVWIEYESPHYNIWSNRYTKESGWGTPERIESDNNGDGSKPFPHLAVDTSGNVTSVWHQSDGTRANIWANRFITGSGWGTAGLIETNNSGGAYSPRLVADSFGNVTVVWYQYDGTRHNIWANRYTVGIGWGTPELIETDNVGDATNPNLVVDSVGDVTVVWRQYDGSQYNIWSNRYIAASGWGTAEKIETNDGSAQFPFLTIDSSGNVFATWVQYDGVCDSVWANRYSAGSGWGIAELIETDNTAWASSPRLIVDYSGDVTVVWKQNNNGVHSVWSNRYLTSFGWCTAEYIEPGFIAGYIQPSVDYLGNVTIIWSQSDGTRANIWAKRFIPGIGWGTAELIETDNAGSAFSPQLVVDTSGNVTAIWYQHDGVRDNIWANRFE